MLIRSGQRTEADFLKNLIDKIQDIEYKITLIKTGISLLKTQIACNKAPRWGLIGASLTTLAGSLGSVAWQCARFYASLSTYYTTYDGDTSCEDVLSKGIINAFHPYQQENPCASRAFYYSDDSGEITLDRVQDYIQTIPELCASYSINSGAPGIAPAAVSCFQEIGSETCANALQEVCSSWGANDVFIPLIIPFGIIAPAVALCCTLFNDRCFSDKNKLSAARSTVLNTMMNKLNLSIPANATLKEKLALLKQKLARLEKELDHAKKQCALLTVSVKQNQAHDDLFHPRSYCYRIILEYAGLTSNTYELKCNYSTPWPNPQKMIKNVIYLNLNTLFTDKYLECHIKFKNSNKKDSCVEIQLNQSDSIIASIWRTILFTRGGFFALNQNQIHALSEQTGRLGYPITSYLLRDGSTSHWERQYTITEQDEKEGYEKENPTIQPTVNNSTAAAIVSDNEEKKSDGPLQQPNETISGKALKKMSLFSHHHSNNSHFSLLGTVVDLSPQTQPAAADSSSWHDPVPEVSIPINADDSKNDDKGQIVVIHL